MGIYKKQKQIEMIEGDEDEEEFEINIKEKWSH